LRVTPGRPGRACPDRHDSRLTGSERLRVPGTMGSRGSDQARPEDRHAGHPRHRTPAPPCRGPPRPYSDSYSRPHPRLYSCSHSCSYSYSYSRFFSYSHYSKSHPA
jgi:hypothetical protein